MDDSISRQEAIDAAIEAAYKWDGCYSVERARIIADDLKALPSAQPESRWIAVEDELPKERGYYEATVSFPDTAKPVRVLEFLPGNSPEIPDRWVFEGGAVLFNWSVKAWRECPKPYERSEKKDE